MRELRYLYTTLVQTIEKEAKNEYVRMAKFNAMTRSLFHVQRGQCKKSV